MNPFYNSSSPAGTGPFVYAPSNEQAAWFAIVYTAACIDGIISDEERDALAKLIGSKELYRGHEILDYYYELMKVKDRLDAREIIRAAAPLVSPEMAPTLFCLAAETLLTKGCLTPQEEELLHFIGEELDLDGRLAGRIMEVLTIKNRGNWRFE